MSALQLAEALRWVPASAPRWAEAPRWVPASVPRLAPASHWVPVSVPRWAEAPRWVPVSAPRWAEAPRWVPAARRDLFPRRSCPSHLIPLLFPGTCRAVSPHFRTQYYYCPPPSRRQLMRKAAAWTLRSRWPVPGIFFFCACCFHLSFPAILQSLKTIPICLTIHNLIH